MLSVNACGSDQLLRAQRQCQRGVDSLKQRIGPEFNKLASVVALPMREPDRYGCLYIFTRILEEMPGEVIGDYGTSSASQEISFLLYDSERRATITIPSTPSYRSESVVAQARLIQTSGDQMPEVVVEERSAVNRLRSKALRIFVYAPGVPTPREVLSISLAKSLGVSESVNTSWSVVQAQGARAILIKGGGRKALYTWSESSQSYQRQSDQGQNHQRRGSTRQAPEAQPAIPSSGMTDQGDERPNEDSVTTPNEFLDSL